MTIPMEKLTLEGFERCMRGQPGLLIGPGLTLGAGGLKEIAHDLNEAFPQCANESDPFLVADCLVAQNVEQARVTESIRSSIQKLRKKKQLGNLATVRWSSVLSFSIDDEFEIELQAWAAKSPVRPRIATIADPTVPVPPRNLPIYEMLGLISRDDFVVTTNDYRLRRTVWPQMLKDFASYVRANSVLCCGFTDCEAMLLEFLAICLASGNTCPRPFVFSSNDPILQSAAFRDLAKRGLRIAIVDATLEAIVQGINRSAETHFTSTLSFESPSAAPLEVLRVFSDLAVVVNLQTTSAIDDRQQFLLQELLFSPTSPNWDVFVRRLDFPRSICSELERKIRNGLAKGTGILQVLVQGPAAVGKTTILKRVALNSVCPDAIVLWFRPYFYQDGPGELRNLMTTIAERKLANGPLVIFVDDPVGLGSLRLEDIAEAVQSRGLSAVIVTGVRTTEVGSSDSAIIIESADFLDECEVPDTFDDPEWEGLAKYLVHLGVCLTLEEAISRVTQAANRSARDVLAMLFILLPETRSHITESVRQELLRLGDRAAFTRLVVGTLKETSQRLREAYELVAVAEKYGAPVPIEVLVSTLNIPYEDWLALASDKGLVWGLLYQESSPDGQTVVYRTRNDVVAEIVVDFVNGGALSRAGEIERLRTLLESCTGSTPPYREFCLRILIPGDNGRLFRLDYEEGARLFEAAIDALPREDRTLLHHFGLWEKNKGNDPLRARTTLQRALRASPYPYSSKAEASEFIHTSLAATELDAIARKLVSFDEGKRSVLKHLERARSAQFINSNATHVQANMIVKLADLTGAPDSPDTIQLITTALADVDRMLLFLRSDFSASDPRRQRSIQMLNDVRSDVINRCASDEVQTDDANRLWRDFRRQEGFVLRSRVLYGWALASGKGSSYKQAYDYVLEARNVVLTAGSTPSVDLDEVYLHVYFHWRVRRYSLSEASAPIDWGLIETLATRLTQASPSQDDPFYHYLLGLSKAHLKKWQDASAIFRRLRSLGISRDALWENRDFLMNENGGMRRIQGLMRSGGSNRFLKVDELGTDLPANRNERWARDGEIEHAYVRFQFAGPLAVHEP